MSGEQISVGSKCRESKCPGSNCRESNCLGCTFRVTHTHTNSLTDWLRERRRTTYIWKKEKKKKKDRPSIYYYIDGDPDNMIFNPLSPKILIFFRGKTNFLFSYIFELFNTVFWRIEISHKMQSAKLYNLQCETYIIKYLLISKKSKLCAVNFRRFGKNYFVASDPNSACITFLSYNFLL